MFMLGEKAIKRKLWENKLVIIITVKLIIWYFNKNDANTDTSNYHKHQIYYYDYCGQNISGAYMSGNTFLCALADITLDQYKYINKQLITN